MFSNGTEYFSFLEDQCGDCPHFVDWHEATKENPCCHVEELIARADRDVFPYSWLDENNYMYRYDCRKKAGLEERVNP